MTWCQWVFWFIPPVLSLVLAVTAGVVGYIYLKPDKLVRIMFPYITRKDDGTAMFGYILSKGSISIFFINALIVMFCCLWIFLSNILIIYKDNNNPYDAYSLKLNCSEKEEPQTNGSITDCSPEEERTKAKVIEKYAINFNIGGAAGQATGALAIVWVISSLLTCLIVSACFKCKSNHKACWNRPKLCKAISLILEAIVIICIPGLYIYIIIYIIIEKGLFVYILIPEYGSIMIIIFINSIGMVAIDINKNPKTLEECCRETMKKRQKERATKEQMQQERKTQKKIFEEMIELEVKKNLVNEVPSCVSENEMCETVNKTLKNIMGINKKEERTETVIPKTRRHKKSKTL